MSDPNDAVSQLIRLGYPSDVALQLERELRFLEGGFAGLDTPASSQTPVAVGGLMVPGVNWAIKDDELKLLGVILTALVTAVSTGWFHSPDTATRVATLVAAVFTMVRQIYKKGARLLPHQFRILASLKSSSDGLTVTELREWLRAHYGDTWTEDSLLGELHELKELRLHDGHVVPMVAVDARARWSAAGV